MKNKTLSKIFFSYCLICLAIFGGLITCSTDDTGISAKILTYNNKGEVSLDSNDDQQNDQPDPSSTDGSSKGCYSNRAKSAVNVPENALGNKQQPPLVTNLDVDPSTHIEIPHPDPMPEVLNIRTTIGVKDTISQYKVVGLPDATQGLGVVKIVSSLEEVKVESSELGNFYATVQAMGGETISLRFNSSPATSIKLTAFEPGHMSPMPAPEPMTSSDYSITRISSDKVRIIAKLASESFTQILALNASNGASRLVTLDQKNRFQLDMPAAPGHMIQLYYDTGELIVTSWNLIAP